MQPRPSAETCGPLRPKLRSFIELPRDGIGVNSPRAVMIAEFEACAPAFVGGFLTRYARRVILLATQSASSRLKNKVLIMRMRKLAVVALLLLASVCAALQFGIAIAADGDQYVGTWKGTWEGAGAS